MNKILDLMEDIYIKKNDNQLADCRLQRVDGEDGLIIYRFDMESTRDFTPEPVILEWKFPAKNVKGVWKSTSDMSKRIEADWELGNHISRISIDAPVISLFGNEDENILCFACSNAINRVEMAAKYREEDNFFYCQIIFFTECKYPITDFNAEIRIDTRKVNFSKALADTSKWWEINCGLSPAPVPEIAKKPLYSTWYQFHQDMDEENLLAECRLAKQLGFDALIIDDGWQTMDNNRGYDFTGDWLPERFSDISVLVGDIQKLGMKVGLWYSVPFCGKNSNAYQRFKGKFLTEDHRWAPVLDPRYPEVREYLTNIYVQAVKEWNLDGLKLDFIDDFKSYEGTSFEKGGGRDFLSINEAVNCLLAKIFHSVKAIRPDIFIEFRQKYIGPAMRQYGNMLRAFDCPGDPTMNRLRIADIKMLGGGTAVHSDMVTWHFEQPVEQAALHYANTLFGVPQLSIMLNKAPESHLEMIRFYTEYWNNNSELFLSGNFTPQGPLTNYAQQKVACNEKIIIGVYENIYITFDSSFDALDVINVKMSEEVVLMVEFDMGEYEYMTFNCRGELDKKGYIELTKGCHMLNIPKIGLIQMTRLKSGA